MSEFYEESYGPAYNFDELPRRIEGGTSSRTESIPASVDYCQTLAFS